MKHFEIFGFGVIVGVILLMNILHFAGFSAAKIKSNFEIEAVSHGAAHFEVNTNGVVSFKWNK